MLLLNKLCLDCPGSLPDGLVNACTVLEKAECFLPNRKPVLPGGCASRTEISCLYSRAVTFLFVKRAAKELGTDAQTESLPSIPEVIHSRRPSGLASWQIQRHDKSFQHKKKSAERNHFAIPIKTLHLCFPCPSPSPCVCSSCLLTYFKVLQPTLPPFHHSNDVGLLPLITHMKTEQVMPLESLLPASRRQVLLGQLPRHHHRLPGRRCIGTCFFEIQMPAARAGCQGEDATLSKGEERALTSAQLHQKKMQDPKVSLTTQTCQTVSSSPWYPSCLEREAGSEEP